MVISVCKDNFEGSAHVAGFFSSARCASGSSPSCTPCPIHVLVAMRHSGDAVCREPPVRSLCEREGDGRHPLDCVLSSLVWLIKCASRDDARTKMVVMRKIGRPVRVRRNRSASRRQHLRSAPRDCKVTLSSPSCARRYHMSHSTLRQRTPSRIAAPRCRTGDGANLTRSGKSPRNSAPRTMRLRRFLRNDAPA